MLARHVVVDGSNIATEGRSMPLLAQLDEAVKQYRKEFPDDIITVVVDATFGHRIPEEERSIFDDAVAHNEVVSPPAGAIGRGDAFLLRVAEKVHATVLSNDSFQEFHGEHAWLFDFGRLIGGKPVPGVGWIFTPRTPVRGPRSREATRTAQRAERKPKPEVQQKKVQKAIEVATEEAVQPDSPSARRRRRSRGGSPPADPVNAPLAFIEFVAAHPLGSPVEGEVENFSSHGAFVIADGARCYIPLSAMGDPPPRAAKEVLRRGETRRFVLQALDPPRRGIELALPEFARVSGAPTAETVEDEIKEGVHPPAPVRKRGGRRAAEPVRDVAAAAPAAAVPEPADVDAPAAPPRKRAARKRAAEPVAAEAAGAAVAEPVPELAPDPVAPIRTRRSPRRRAAADVGAAEPVASPELVPELTAFEPVAAEPAPAPAPRKRASRKKAAEPVADLAAAEAPPAEPVAAPRKRASRKKAAAGEVPADLLAAPAPVAPAPEAAEPVAAARKRAAPRKKAAADLPAAVAAPAPEVAAPPEAVPEPAPARKRASRSKAAAAPAAGAPAEAPANLPARSPARPVAVKKAAAKKAARPRKAPPG